jgi:branched-chain amino acid transport system ATP-binding protein
MSVLETRECSIRFGGVQAAKDVSISVGDWEIVGVIGPNGAGKTTTFNMITGFYTPNEGRVLYKGTDVTAYGVHERTALGMGRTFQNVGLVKGSTVRENLLSAQHLRAAYASVAGMLGVPRTFRTELELRRRARLILELVGLEEFADSRVAGLPYGVLKRVELAAVLATDPDVLLLDEPSSGMGPEEAHQLGDTLLELRNEFGLSIVMIEHHVPLVVRVCDYVYCLSFGQLLAEGKPLEVRNNPQVVVAYLGEEAAEEVVGKKAAHSAEEALEHADETMELEEA